MAQGIQNKKMAVVPTIPYRNPSVMVDWLCEAFGFEKGLVIKSESGDVKYAHLSLGGSTIMVFPVQDLATEMLVAHPDQVGGVETQTCYIVVADVGAHYATAKEKGAEIIFGVRTGNYGGRGYACRDPEGHIWMFGTYNPQPARSIAPRLNVGRHWPSQRAYRLTQVLSILTLASAGAAFWTYSAMHAKPTALFGFAAHSDAPQSVETVNTLLNEERSARRDAEQRAKELATRLTDARTVKESAEQKIAELTRVLGRETATQQGKEEALQLLAQVTRDRDDLMRTAKHAQDQLEQARIAKEAAERTAKEAAVAKAIAERFANETNEKCEHAQERAVKDAVDLLARERSARAAAELAANELRNQLAALGTEPQHRIYELRIQIEAEQRARSKMEAEARDAKLLLVQEKYSRDTTERALKQAQQKLAANEGSCWACPTGAPCERPPG
jgi:uncharacterized glyoxalase superfamily protein PhnB